MTIAAITIWEGTLKGIEMLVEGSKLSAPIHKEMGAKNPRLWRTSVGPEVHQAIYEMHFDSHEAYGRFTDKMMSSDWWAGTSEWMRTNHGEIKNMGTTVLYDALAD